MSSKLPAGWGRFVQRCALCGRPVLWALTTRGRRMPLDPAADATGNTAVHRDGAGTLRARVLSKDYPAADAWETLLVPHFATCPKADRVRTPPAAPVSLPANVVSLDAHRRRKR
ncbi:MAG TPA: hypothetical protein VIQ30_22770 [Pseudonocardia sp.]